MELIKISEGEIGGAIIQTVNARDLHASLQVEKDFSTWIKDRIGQFEFAEGADFVTESRSPISGSGMLGAARGF
jgi:anti-repressor protein